MENRGERDPTFGTANDVRGEFADSAVDGHVALFYDSRASQLATAAAFVDHSLRTGRQCLYIADDNDPDRVRSAFETAGIDVESRVEARDLLIRNASDVYLSGGGTIGELVEALRQACHDSVAAGYEGLSVAGENTWSFRTGAAFDGVVEFEAEFDACCPEIPATTLCQYNLDRFDETAVAKALWTHEHVVYDGLLCENPYYVPPEEYDGMDDPSANAALMLEQTYDLERTRRRIERSEQRLSVVDRILRHNVRNDLNVVLGHLDLLRKRCEFDDEEREILDTASRVAERVVERAEKSQYVQQTLSESSVEPVELASVVDAAVAEVIESHPAAEISVAGARDRTVLADTNLRTALVELLTNAVVHQETDAPEAELSITETDRYAVVEVANDGPPIPEADRRALAEGEETPLNHADGVGLWLVKWVVDNSGGALWFPDGGDDRCRVAVGLRPVED